MDHKPNFSCPGVERVWLNGLGYQVYVFPEGGKFTGEAIDENGRTVIRSSECDNCEDCWAFMFGALHIWAGRGKL